MPTTIASHRRESSDAPDKQIGELVPDSEPIVFTARDWQAFLAAWDDVDRPRPRLEALVRRYRNYRQPDAG